MISKKSSLNDWNIYNYLNMYFCTYVMNDIYENVL